MKQRLKDPAWHFVYYVSNLTDETLNRAVITLAGRSDYWSKRTWYVLWDEMLRRAHNP